MGWSFNHNVPLFFHLEIGDNIMLWGLNERTHVRPLEHKKHSKKVGYAYLWHAADFKHLREVYFTKDNQAKIHQVLPMLLAQCWPWHRHRKKTYIPPWEVPNWWATGSQASLNSPLSCEQTSQILKKLVFSVSKDSWAFRCWDELKLKHLVREWRESL